jgi:hypothetical protein
MALFVLGEGDFRVGCVARRRRLYRPSEMFQQTNRRNDLWESSSSGPDKIAIFLRKVIFMGLFPD